MFAKMISEMVKQDQVYVGTLIRDEIRNQFLKNGYVIHNLKAKGIEMTDTVFSNKIYGERDTFTPQEITAINEILGTKFKAA